MLLLCCYTHDEAPMLGWFKALMPKEDRFFTLFVQHATIVVAGAEALRGVLKGGDEVEHYCRIVSDHEKEADEITRQVLIAVRRTVINYIIGTELNDDLESVVDRFEDVSNEVNALIVDQL